jgi:hypothetical protein
MDKQSRREALRQYKEQAPAVGVFAVRCTATGQVWVGASKNLAQQQNPIWFGLKMGSYINKQLQAAWSEHGEAAFAFEVLETLDAKDASRLALDLMLKDAHQRWRDRLGAPRLVG